MDIENLLPPLPGEWPCGRNLEDTQLLLSFDAYRVFANDLLDPLISWNWPAIKAHALEVLQQSKDLRVLAYLGAAVLRTDGLHAYLEVLSVATQWLRSYWDELYPLADDDAIARRSALMCLTDSWSILDGLRRVPMITHQQLGSVNLRDLEIADGIIIPSDYEPVGPDKERIRTITQAIGFDALRDLRADLQCGIDSLTAIDGSLASKVSLGQHTSAARVRSTFYQMTGKVSEWQWSDLAR
jgi:hypothetical protein